MDTYSRRQALVRLAAAGGALALSSSTPLASSAESLFGPNDRDDDRDELPARGETGIEHIVLLMMENRSFDHLLGWLPGADGRQAGLRYLDKNGAQHHTHHLSPDFQGCAFADPDHSFEGGRIEYDNGRCDGWLRAGNNDLFSIGYYTRPDLSFLGQIAPRFASPDRYFAAILGPTFPNRIVQHAAQTDRLSNTLAVSTLPTIWDRLAQAGLSGKYYFSDLPVLSLWGQKYTSISRPIDTFFVDAADDNLPAVAYIDPKFVGEEQGVSNDDHPHADVRNGEVFMNSIYRAVTTGPAWRKTVLVINFDEWGGFFDHVPPPRGPVTDAERARGYTDGLRGFRVPCLVISPWSQHGRVPHAVYDHTSILKMIEWRFGLQPLSVRDAAARNLADVLDFGHPRFQVPQPKVPAGPFGGACSPNIPVSGPAAIATLAGSSSTPFGAPWHALRSAVREFGFPVAEGFL